MPEKAVGPEEYCLDLASWSLWLKLDQVEKEVRRENGIFVEFDCERQKSADWRNISGKLFLR